MDAPSPTPAGAPTSAPETVSQCLGLLSRKDDTSRFVGLAMLSSLLSHIRDRAILSRCWAALDPRFLERLLRADKKKNTPEAHDMVDLAVNVIHAFATVLPDAAENTALVARAPGMVRVLPECSVVTAAAVVQTLLIFATGRAGAAAVLETDLAVLLAKDGAMNVLVYAFENAPAAAVEARIGGFLKELCAGLPGAERERRGKVMAFLSELLTRTPAERLPEDTAWVISLYAAIEAVITARHGAQERYHTTVITAALLHRYPPTLLFRPSPGEKPPLYLLLQLTLIDLRASFPSLLASLSDPSYAATATRLAAGFDIAAAFLSHLLTSPTPALGVEALLRLRRDLGETFSLTLEFLRERWDGAVAGAEGLEVGFGQLAITWESPLPGGVLRDPVVVAGVRALGLWVGEDESLRAEAAGMVDFFLGLWKGGGEVGVDYRPWVLGALQGVVEGVEGEFGRAQFEKYGGWETVCGDLKRVWGLRGEKEELMLGVGEARLLAEVVVMGARSDGSRCKEVCKLLGEDRREIHPELQAEVLKLASACLANVPRGVLRGLVPEVTAVRAAAERLGKALRGRREEGDDDEEAMALVVEVLEELEELGV